MISHISHLFCIYPSRYSCTTLFILYLLTIPVNASHHVSLTFKQTPTLHSVKIILSVPIVFFDSIFHKDVVSYNASVCLLFFHSSNVFGSKVLFQLQSRRISIIFLELLITLVRTLLINPLPYFCLPQNGYQFLPLELWIFFSAPTETWRVTHTKVSILLTGIHLGTTKSYYASTHTSLWFIVLSLYIDILYPVLRIDFFHCVS